MNESYIKLNGSILTEMFKSVNAISKEIRLYITENGLETNLVNPTNTAMIHLNLPKDIFFEYNITPGIIGIDLHEWNKAIKYIGKKEEVEIAIQLDVSVIGNGLKYGELSIQTSDGFESILKILDPESIRKEPKKPEFTKTASVVMPTKRFMKLLKNSWMTRKYIQFTIENDVFITESDSGINKSISKTTSSNVNCIIQGNGKSLYLLEELINITKTIKSDLVTLEFSNNYPLLMSFDVLNQGKVECFLAPRIKSE